VLSNAKWPMLENITAATLYSEDMREAFITFWASECGDVVSKFVDEGSYIQAQARKGFLPDSVLRDKDKLIKALRAEKIPIPGAVYDVLAENITSDKDAANREFRKFNDQLGEAPKKRSEWQHIDCFAYLYLITQTMRWQAGNAYNQFIQEASDHGVTEDQVVYNFLYGWDINESNNLEIDEQKHFIQDMILLHIFRNELAIAPSTPSDRWSPAEKSENYSQSYLRQTGSKSKYGELYTWAKMMPYMQGLLLYVITIAYPFCCILVVMPGWHKIMFTWMGFFAWAKSWDFGFAMVMTIERSLWAMLGNTKESLQVNEKILAMQEKIGFIDVKCPEGAAGTCPLPIVEDGTNQTNEAALALFDYALAMAGSLEFDLKNAYYVYLMSALYFAVPAVTGQILLGARSGASSMVNTMVGQTAQEGGRKSGEGFSSEEAMRFQTGHGLTGRTAQAKHLRKTAGSGSDFLGRAFDGQFQSQSLGAQNQMLDHNSRQMGQMQSRNSDANSSFQANNGLMQTMMDSGHELSQASQQARIYRRIADQAGGPGGGGGPGSRSGDAGTIEAAPAVSTPGAGGNGQNGQSGNPQLNRPGSGRLDIQQAGGNSGTPSVGGNPAGGGGGGGGGTQTITVSGGGAPQTTGGDGGGSFGEPERDAVQAEQRAKSARYSGASKTLFALGNLQSMNDTYGANAMLGQRMANMGRQSGFNGMQQQSLNAMSPRYEQAAQQQLSDARWKAMRGYSKKVAGKSAAIGVLVGTFHPGEKSVTSMNGLAGLGEAGAYHQAGYNSMSMSGAYGQVARNAHAGMIGGGHAGLQYHAASPVSAFTQSSVAATRDIGYMGNNPNGGTHSGTLMNNAKNP
ncbi:MAG: hypothetical protein KDD62_03055, partial [Bdellovibrionales bacterium]|nr:hypothetical protein [Bdellovibrionales bacterium]